MSVVSLNLWQFLVFVFYDLGAFEGYWPVMLQNDVQPFKNLEASLTLNAETLMSVTVAEETTVVVAA